jgi:hypothetical protein
MTAALTTFSTRKIEQLLAAPQIQTAFRFFEANAETITKEHIAICSIPAPPFEE